MALAPAAFASPQTKVNFFKYNPADATHHALWFNATNTGANPYQDFEIELTQNTKISNVVLYIVGKKRHTRPSAWPRTAVGRPSTARFRRPCSSRGRRSGIKFNTSTVYPAGSQNLWFADDQQTGANEGEFDGPQ